MAKIVDPDQLNQGVEVVFSTGAKTWQLLVAGNLDDGSPGAISGVSLQAGYSHMKEEWRIDASLNKFKFPLKMFGKTEGLFQNGWAPADAQTRDLIRDAGWQEIDGSQRAGIISLGDFDADTDPGYYLQDPGTTTPFDGTTASFDKTGEINEAVVVHDGGAGDYTGFLKLFNRVQGKIYSEYEIVREQNLSALEPIVFRAPLTSTPNPNVVASDVTIDGNAPYTGMSISFLKGSGFTTWANSTVYAAGAVVQALTGRWFFTPAGGTSSGTDVGDDVGVTDWEAYVGERQVGANWYAFNVIIEGNSGTAQEIHEYEQRQLRQTGNINNNLLGSPNQNAYGTVNGNICKQLTRFVGDNLHTGGAAGYPGGVFIDNISAGDVNNITYYDITVDSGGLNTWDEAPVVSTARITPFVSTYDFNFLQAAIDDVNGEYTVYFLNNDTGDNDGSDFDTANAIIVNDNGGSPLQGLSITALKHSHDFDYDGNVQRGAGSAGTDAPIVIQVVGEDQIEILDVEFLITRNAGLQFNVNTLAERVYANP